MANRKKFLPVIGRVSEKGIKYPLTKDLDRSDFEVINISLLLADFEDNALEVNELYHIRTPKLETATK